ncbi:elongation factor 4 [Striga asiatica]|uniref:Elongation factor 4 n=1 Tax=Striga asiatica TaxID=4170 RepID=A0A5A7Q4B0_STRAF|nr:elongation factor 4 [Striga asiatica]
MSDSRMQATSGEAMDDLRQQLTRMERNLEAYFNHVGFKPPYPAPQLVLGVYLTRRFVGRSLCPRPQGSQSWPQKEAAQRQLTPSIPQSMAAGGARKNTLDLGPTIAGEEVVVVDKTGVRGCAIF